MKFDLENIENMAKEKEDENWDFRTFLKGCDPEEVDRKVHELYAHYQEIIDCQKCANCCKKLRVQFGKEELVKVAKELGLSFMELIDRYQLKADSAVFIPKTDSCPFLEEQKCTIYPLRAETCRTYPHLQKNNFSSRLISVIDNCAICPITYYVMEDLKDILWKEDLTDDFWF